MAIHPAMARVSRHSRRAGSRVLRFPGSDTPRALAHTLGGDRDENYYIWSHHARRGAGRCSGVTGYRLRWDWKKRWDWDRGRGRERRLQDRHRDHGRFGGECLRVVAVLERRPREHPRRDWVDDFLGQRVQARAGLDVQAHGEGRGRRAPVRVLDREPDRAERCRLSPGSRLERVRARARDRKAPVGVSMQSAGEERTGTERRRRRRWKGLRAHPDGGLCGERHHRADGVGQAAISSARIREPLASSHRWPTGGFISPASTARGPVAGCCWR